jgi:glycosyltransferase involved in cell wall biosynthesis
VRHVHPSVRCLLVGATAPADQTFEDELRNLVMALGLNEHVVFAGFHRNVMDVLMLADVVVHASILPEPFGRVILEAMACRKPVIATKAGGVPEIIDEGRTGLMFPPGDCEALAAAILDLLADRARAARFGEAGFQRVNERFHIARNAEQTVRLYDQLLGASSS